MQSHFSNYDNLNKSFKAANRFISYRPRSELEIREKLLTKFPSSLVQKTIDLLKSQNKINDSLFAKFWVDKYTNSSYRSSSFIKTELIKKGLDPDIINGAIEEIDDEHLAFLSARKAIKNFLPDNYQSFTKKILNTLNYRGFDYSLSCKIAEELWREKPETIA